MTDYSNLTDALANPSSITHLKVGKDEDASEVLERLGEFSSLERLYMRSGIPKTLPAGVTAPKTLREVEIVVTDLEEETLRIIESFPELEVLEIWGRHLKEGTLPTKIEALTKLRELHFVSCGISDLPDEIKNLTALEKLYIRGCPVKSFPMAIARIPHLKLLDLRSQLASLPDELSQLKELTHLNLTGSLNKGLSGSDAEFVKPVPTVIGTLSALEVLGLGQCGVDKELGMLAGLTKLRELDLSWGKLSDLSGLKSLSSLESLKLENCYQVLDLAPLADLPALHTLDLSSNHYIEDIESLSALKQLKVLDIEGCSDIKNLRPILEHESLETLIASNEVMEKWQQRQLLRDMPSQELLLEQLASENFPVVAKALEQITAFVTLNSTNQKSAAFSFFGVEEEDEEEIVDVPILDSALDKWGMELPAPILVAVVRMCMVSIIENLRPALTASRLLAKRGDVDAQKEVAAIFHKACESYDAGHRFWSNTVLDQLLDEVFDEFHPAALAALLEDCGTDALNSGSGDGMDGFFQVAFAKTDELDQETTESLSNIFCEYAKTMIGYDEVDLIEGLRSAIREVNPDAGAAIDKALISEERKIGIRRQVDGVYSPESLAKIVEAMVSQDDPLTFEELDDSGFSRQFAKHSGALALELRMAVLRQSWRAKSRGWDWARISLNEVERDAEEFLAAMKSYLGSEPDADAIKHLLGNLRLAKRIQLSRVEGDPQDRDKLAATIRSMQLALYPRDEKEALSEELSAMLLAFAQGRADSDWKAAVGTLTRISNQGSTVATNWEHFSYLQMNYENLVRQGQRESKYWDQVREFLTAFVASTKRIEWGQASIETIAADGVAAAQLSGDADITELVLNKLLPDPIEKDRLAFNLACYYANKKDRDNVIRFTTRALELGKASAQFVADDDFAPFREDTEFKALLANY